ncbi:hypothetical protein A2311_05690 [candidate division WOR-1 bacterium RIFOXYB2_FULL_48_7]|uniref:Carrier domain-containing protein n=1 Tax=candidate division WOR-1 bacterium RIFOXYB2_FULL_48_7 TaxID=1802583 RepID=A0A1F4TL90_UNCSA|nr:MAG: hypothetical protein A2311_05690 [candidate division WOR-1 bacterium RIFOXYB2_FULL_48_7]
MDQIKERLKKMLVDKLRLKRTLESIKDNEPLFREGLGLDSIDSLEIVVLIEREFDLSISADELKDTAKIFKDVQSLADFVALLLTKK